MIDDCLAEASALLRIVERDLVGRTRHAYGLRGDTNPAAFQIGQRNTIPLAFGAKAVLFGHAKIFEMNLAGIRSLLPHLLFSAPNAITRLFGVDDEAADAVFAVAELGCGKYQCYIGVLARGNEVFCSVEDISSVAPLGPRPNRTGIRAALRFRKAEGAQHLAARHRS